MRGPVRALALAVILLGSVPIVTPPPAQALGSVAVYMGGLNWPIALAFSPDGRIFFAERLTGQIRVIENDFLLPAPFYTLPNTATAGERGLLGLTLDPGFPTVPWVYAYQTYNDVANGTVNNRIVRILASGNTGVSMQLLLRMPPLSGATNHNGGVIAFGPDFKLYAVVGENANIALAQNMMSPMGKVLRMNPDGTVPTDNPFYGSLSADNLIYTFGHRNMFGLAFHPSTGRAYVTENGPSCNDEVNLLVAGGNFGWGTTQTCASPPPPPNNTNRDGPLPINLPIWWWGSTICPTNAAIYRGPNFTAWRGDLLMGDCNFRRLHRLDLAPPNYDAVLSDDILWTAPGPVLDVESGPDGAIWFTTTTTIYRYYDTARPPNAQFSATPPQTTPGNPITFDGSASSDPDGTIVSWTWDFGDTQTGSGPVVNHAYTAPGTYTVTLTIVDNESLSDTATTDVIVNPFPFATFTMGPSPAAPAQPVTFDGSGSSGNLVSYDWTFGDGNTASGAIVAHAYASPGSYTVTLTVTDDQSQQDSEAQVLRVNAPPIASFVADPPQTVMGQAVTLNATTSSDSDGTIASHAWAFGDGNTATGAVVMHTYSSKGPFVVRLTVTDNDGATSETTRTVLVANRPPVIVAASPSDATARMVADGSLRLNVTALDPDLDPLTYTWRVDGVLRGADAPVLVLTGGSPGTYVVNVTVSDGEGNDWRQWTLDVEAPSGGAGATPWIVAALLAVVLAFVVFAVWRRRRRRDRRGP